MFEVIKQTINNPFKPEIVDTTTIILKQVKPFVQMSYQYEGDHTELSDEEATHKVLEDFYSENYSEKIQNSKITELELKFAKQEETLEKELNDIKLQNSLITESLFEVIELLLADEPAEDIIEDEPIEEESNNEDKDQKEEGGIDESDNTTDGN